MIALASWSLIPCAFLAGTQLFVQFAIGKSIRFLVIVSLNVPEAYYRTKLRHLVDTFDQRLPKVQIRNSVAFGVPPPIHFPLLHVLCDVFYLRNDSLGTETLICHVNTRSASAISSCSCNPLPGVLCMEESRVVVVHHSRVVFGKF